MHETHKKHYFASFCLEELLLKKLTKLFCPNRLQRVEEQAEESTSWLPKSSWQKLWFYRKVRTPKIDRLSGRPWDETVELCFYSDSLSTALHLLTIPTAHTNSLFTAYTDTVLVARTDTLLIARTDTVLIACTDTVLIARTDTLLIACTDTLLIACTDTPHSMYWEFRQHVLTLLSQLILTLSL
jgi:hypothetical protein